MLIPSWISIPDDPARLSARDELNTPFGVYSLMTELTARSREIARTPWLFIGYNTSGYTTGRGLRKIEPKAWYERWGTSHNLVCDQADEHGNPIPLRVRLDRIRLTYLELHQQPIAHRETTLARDYLARNGTGRLDYQKVVAEALSAEVGKARERATITHLAIADIANGDSADGPPLFSSGALPARRNLPTVAC